MCSLGANQSPYRVAPATARKRSSPNTCIDPTRRGNGFVLHRLREAYAAIGPRDLVG